MRIGSSIRRWARPFEGRLRTAWRRWHCFDRDVEFIERPRRAGATAEGSPLFDWSRPVRLRLREGWCDDVPLQVALSAPPGAHPCRVRLRAGAHEAHALLEAPREWEKVLLGEGDFGAAVSGDAVLELSVEPPGCGVRLGEIRRASGNTSRVLHNLRRNRSEAAQRLPVLRSFPAKLTVESTDACNLRCVMCPHGSPRKLPARHLPLPLLDAVTPALRHAHEIQLHGLGEPLLSPAFWKALEITADQPESDVGINSNLTVLDDDRIARILASSLRYVNVSLDAATSETFRRIRGHDLDAVLGNVRRLVAARDAAGREHPRIYVNMTLMRENVREAPDLVGLAHRLGADRVYLWHLNEGPMYEWTVERNGFRFDYREQQLSRHPALSNAMLRAAVERAEKEGIELCLDHNKVVFFDEAGGEAEDAQPAAEAAPAGAEVTVADCTHPWEWAFVKADGEVRPCCFMIPPLATLGEGPGEAPGLEAVWNGEPMQALRRDLARGVLHPLCRDAACKYAAGSQRRERRA